MENIGVYVSVAVMFVTNLVSFAFGYGKLSNEIKSINKSINRLEEKQDKHNGLIERMAVVEQTAKNNNRRLEVIELQKK